MTDNELKTSFSNAIEEMWAQENPEFMPDFVTHVVLPTTKRLTTESGDPIVAEVRIYAKNAGSVNFDQTLVINGIAYRGAYLHVEKRQYQPDFITCFGVLQPCEWSRQATDAAKDSVLNLAKEAWTQALKLFPEDVFDLAFLHECYNDAVSAKRELTSAIVKAQEKKAMALAKAK